MSWLFGIKKDPIPDMSFSGAVGSGGAGRDPPGNIDSSGSKSGGEAEDIGKTSSYSFDSTALERAAKAARELENSPHARDILELQKINEHNKELEHTKDIKAYEIQIEQAKKELIQNQGEERRKTIAEESKHIQQRAQYQDQLARKRHEDQALLQQRIHEESLRKQEESLAKQEAMRRATFEREMELREKSDLKKIEAKIMAKAKADRENQDLRLEQIRVEATEVGMQKLKWLTTATSVLGQGFKDFIMDGQKLTATVVGVTFLAAGFYSAKSGIHILADVIRSQIAKPVLVMETSRLTLTDTLKHPINTAKRLLSKPEDVMKGVIFQPTLEEELRKLAVATRNKKRNRGKFQNLLFYGPPGTGKTLFAKRLATYSGLHYGIINGSDIAPLGKNAVPLINKTFDWAARSRRGLLLFVDEADAFLTKRDLGGVSEDARVIVNSFLARLGTQTDKYMVVLATNTPEILDTAMRNRIDRDIAFSAPGLPERERLVRLYFDECVLIPATDRRRRFKVEQFDYGQICTEVAQLTEGFVGRDIMKLAYAWQTAAEVSDDGVLTRDMIMSCVHSAVRQFHIRKSQEKYQPVLPFTHAQLVNTLSQLKNQRVRRRRYNNEIITEIN